MYVLSNLTNHDGTVLPHDYERRGMPGTYTQGTDFDNETTTPGAFQAWLDENINNRFFDGTVRIIINTDITSIVRFENITQHYSYSFTIQADAQVGSMLSINSCITSFVIEGTAPVTASYISMRRTSQITFRGARHFSQVANGSFFIGAIRIMVEGALTFDPAYGIEVYENAVLSIVLTGSLSCGVLNNHGTVVIASTVAAGTAGINYTSLSPGSRGQIIDNRAENLLDTWQRKNVVVVDEEHEVGKWFDGQPIFELTMLRKRFPLWQPGDSTATPPRPRDPPEPDFYQEWIMHSIQLYDPNQPRQDDPDQPGYNSPIQLFPPPGTVTSLIRRLSNDTLPGPDDPSDPIYPLPNVQWQATDNWTQPNGPPTPPHFHWTVRPFLTQLGENFSLTALGLPTVPNGMFIVGTSVGFRGSEGRPSTWPDPDATPNGLQSTNTYTSAEQPISNGIQQGWYNIYADSGDLLQFRYWAENRVVYRRFRHSDCFITIRYLRNANDLT
jgi:hypothetical protein